MRFMNVGSNTNALCSVSKIVILRPKAEDSRLAEILRFAQNDKNRNKT